MTFVASPNNARERVARSEISENALGGRSSPGAWAAASPSIGIAPKPTNKNAIEIFNMIFSASFLKFLEGLAYPLAMEPECSPALIRACWDRQSRDRSRGKVFGAREVRAGASLRADRELGGVSGSQQPNSQYV
jgi:hypothetical protein